MVLIKGHGLKKIFLIVVDVVGFVFGFFNKDFIRTRMSTIVFRFRRAFLVGRGVDIGLNSIVRSNVVINTPRRVSVGKNSSIGDFCHIWGGGGVKIGHDVLIAAHCAISSQTHQISGVLYRETIRTAPVVIGNNVWLGTGVTILPGVVIGDNSVIGAGSVVCENVPANTVAAGVPARVLREL